MREWREKERLTIICDEMQDKPAVRGYEDSVTLEGCPVPVPILHVRMDLSDEPQNEVKSVHAMYM